MQGTIPSADLLREYHNVFVVRQKNYTHSFDGKKILRARKAGNDACPRNSAVIDIIPTFQLRDPRVFDAEFLIFVFRRHKGFILDREIDSVAAESQAQV